MAAGTFDHIPTIDVAPSYDGSDTARDTLARALGDTLEHVGFAYITGHAVPAGLVEGLRQEAKDFLRPAHGRQTGDRHQCLASRLHGAQQFADRHLLGRQGGKAEPERIHPDHA